MGCSTRGGLVDAVKLALTNSNRIQELEASEHRLIREKEALQARLKAQEERTREATNRAMASSKVIVYVREALALPAEVVNKARLFEVRLAEEGTLSRNKIIRFLVDQAVGMERTLGEMRILADNMLPLEDPTTGQREGKQPADLAPNPEAGPSSRPGKLVRKAVMVSESEEEEVAAARSEEGEEPLKLTRRPKYRTTPFGSGAAEVPVAGSPKSPTQPTPVSGSASPAVALSPAQVTPSPGGRRYSLQKQTPGSGR